MVETKTIGIVELRDLLSKVIEARPEITNENLRFAYVRDDVKRIYSIKMTHEFVSDLFTIVDSSMKNTQEDSEIKDEILNTVSDLVAKFMYYDRKEDENLRVGSIQKAIKEGRITVFEIVNKFRTELLDARHS